MQEEEGISSTSERSTSISRRKKMKMWICRKMKIKETSMWKYRWRFLGSAFKWKRVHLQLSFFDNLVFKIMSFLEAVVLVSTLTFFFLCCGCHF